MTQTTSLKSMAADGSTAEESTAFTLALNNAMLAEAKPEEERSEL
jgi:hypothetical protein